ncbi:MAG: alpha/beta hydrolase [Clostridiales bacterium]|nr:alpha/beta hydrolase [Clostridiales bacterium]
MKKKRHAGRVILIVVLCILILVGVVLAVNHSTTYIVFRNLTAKKIDMDESTSWDGGESYLGVQYSEVSDSDVLDLYVPSDVENPKLFVLVHGGGFISNDQQSRQAQLMYRYFRDHGYACATVNYRLAQEAAYPAAVQDVKAAVRYLRAHADTYGYDAEHVAIWGESAGGYLAVMAAVTNDEEFTDLSYVGEEEQEENISASVDVLVDFYGCIELGTMEGQWDELGIPRFIIKIANSWLDVDILEGYEDVESYWLRQNTSEMTEEELAYCNPHTYVEENLADSGMKIWIAHGDCDITVPILQSQDLYETACRVLGEENVTFHTVKDSGHAGDIMYTDEELEKVKEFLDANL